MQAQQQPHTRWTVLNERWHGHFARFRQMVSPFSHGPERRLKPWAAVVVAVGLLVLASLLNLWWFGSKSSKKE